MAACEHPPMMPSKAQHEPLLGLDVDVGALSPPPPMSRAQGATSSSQTGDRRNCLFNDAEERGNGKGDAANGNQPSASSISSNRALRREANRNEEKERQKMDSGLRRALERHPNTRVGAATLKLQSLRTCADPESIDAALCETLAALESLPVEQLRDEQSTSIWKYYIKEKEVLERRAQALMDMRREATECLFDGSGGLKKVRALLRRFDALQVHDETYTLLSDTCEALSREASSKARSQQRKSSGQTKAQTFLNFFRRKSREPAASREERQSRSSYNLRRNVDEGDSAIVTRSSSAVYVRSSADEARLATSQQEREKRRASVDDDDEEEIAEAVDVSVYDDTFISASCCYEDGREWVERFEESGLRREEECVVCCVSTPSILLDPCGHLCLCYECMREYLHDREREILREDTYLQPNKLGHVKRELLCPLCRGKPEIILYRDY